MVAAGVVGKPEAMRITGPGITSRFGFNGTDLCYMWQNRKGYVHSLHGDTFTDESPWCGGNWRSPVSLRTSNRDLGNGIRWDNAVDGPPGVARQIIGYTHYSEPAPYPNAVTHIPNDGLQLPNGDTVISTFAVHSWKPHPQTGSWSTNYAAMWLSHQEDAHWYEPGPFVTFRNQGRYRLFQNQSMILWNDGRVYIFGTVQGRSNDGGVYLMRHKWERMNDESGWEFWGWHNGTWSWGRHDPTPIFVAADMQAREKLGEINAQVIEGHVVLSYTDYSIGVSGTRVATGPDRPWTSFLPQITAPMAPRMYMPAIHPWSTLDDTHFALSQWIGAKGEQFVMYGVRQWHGSTNPNDPQIPTSARLAGTGAAYYATDLDERGFPHQLPEGSPQGILDGVRAADRAHVLSDLSTGTIGTDEFQECLDLTTAGKVIPRVAGKDSKTEVPSAQ
jgi:hypothetical protein